MNFQTDELKDARQASYMEAGALGLSFLSPLLGPLTAVPAVCLAHLARFRWRRTNYENCGGTALLALFVGYSFLVAFQAVAVLVLAVFLRAGTSAAGMLMIYWLIGLLILVISSWPYLFATRPVLTCNATALLLGGILLFGLCSCGIQQARESSRRNQAIQRLQTIGIGMQRAQKVGHPPDRYEHFIPQESLEMLPSENDLDQDLR